MLITVTGPDTETQSATSVTEPCSRAKILRPWIMESYPKPKASDEAYELNQNASISISEFATDSITASMELQSPVPFPSFPFSFFCLPYSAFTMDFSSIPSWKMDTIVCLLIALSISPNLFSNTQLPIPPKPKHQINKKAFVPRIAYPLNITAEMHGLKTGRSCFTVYSTSKRDHRQFAATGLIVGNLPRAGEAMFMKGKGGIVYSEGDLRTQHRV